MANHKYIDKKFVNGVWKYIYDNVNTAKTNTKWAIKRNVTQKEKFESESKRADAAARYNNVDKQNDMTAKRGSFGETDAQKKALKDAREQKTIPYLNPPSANKNKISVYKDQARKVKPADSDTKWAVKRNKSQYDNSTLDKRKPKH